MASRDSSYPAGESPVKADGARGTPVADPLWLDVVLDHRAEVPLFGVLAVVESNAPDIAALVERAFGDMPRLTAGGGVPATRVRLRVIVEPTVTNARPLDVVQWRQPDPDHLLVRGAGLAGYCDLPAGEGTMFVEEYRLRDTGLSAGTVIRPPVLGLLNRRDRHPVHAAALRVGDAGLILLGTSGSGKSTLGYAASRAGIDVLTDDAVRVQRVPELRFWGTPGHVNLLDDARARFGELAGRQFERAPANNGTKHVVTLAVRPAQVPWVRRVRVCLLRRDRGAVERTPASPDDIERAILDAPESRSDASPVQRAEVARILAAGGGWHLTLSGDAGDAVPHLQAMLDDVVRG